MKHLYNTRTALQTESKAFIEANYNRTVYSMSDPGEVLYYKAPQDPAEHPMYVDAEGRNVPVSPATLQPMTNASGNLVDKNGALLPAYEFEPADKLPHKDDVRVAVVGADFEVKDEEGNDIFIAHDGEIIPTDDEGVPNTIIVNGEAWVVGKDGQPHAPLDRIYPLHSYANPVRAQNRPVTKPGGRAPLVDDEYEEYFDIASIVKSNRPSTRGVLYGWAAEEGSASSFYAGSMDYRQPRFYPASENAPYKYWASPLTSDATPTVTGSDVTIFDNQWRVVNGANVTHATNQISADFGPRAYSFTTDYIEKVITLDDTTGYEVSLSGLAQSVAQIDFVLYEWSDVQPATPNYHSGSLIKKTDIGSKWLAAGRSESINFEVTPSAGSKSHALRFVVRRPSYVTNRRVTLMNMSFKRAVFPIAGVGPRAVYDRPLDANKIVIGVDYSVDERGGLLSSVNKPVDYQVRVYRDRGDGQFVWQTVATNPEINEDGHIVLNFNGSTWGRTATPGAVTQIMGVQLAVFGMKRRDARVNVMEISARRRYDVSDLLMEYSYDTSVSEDSFVLPFGTVSSNSGSLQLSNHDGRFNPDNRFLLNRGGVAADGSDTFTNTPNPFYKMLNDSVAVEIETATFIPGGTEKDFIRMVTAKTEGGVNAGSSMTATFDLSDDARLLEKTDAPPLFFYGTTMSVIEILYMLLDSIGFTSVKFSQEDEHFSTHLKYFWTKKESDNVWSVIADVCRATQTVAYFDEFNVLNFKSLRGLYEDALSKAPAHTLTSEDLPDVLANIKNMELDSTVAVNKVNVNYRETTEPEKTPSGDTPMTIVWEPEGTQVVRANHLLEDLGDKQVGLEKASRFLTLPPGSTKTWPFSGTVSVEGEFIKYDGKQYRYHRADDTIALKMIKTEDERKELDKLNEFLAHKNTWSGKLRIVERGAEGTVIRPHGKGDLSDFNCRFRSGNKVTENYRRGLSIKGSRLHIQRQANTIPQATTTITKGNIYNSRPVHIGTRFRIGQGQNAGLCFGMSSPSEDGIFVEVTTTEGTEAQGRPRGELHFFVRKNGVLKMHGFGTDVPISLHQDYDLDVSIKDGTRSNVRVNHSLYYEISLKYGDKGNNVRYLQTALNLHNERLVIDGIFGKATRDAVRRLQQRRGLTRDGVVNIEEWQAMESGAYDGRYMTIHATIDGNYAATATILTSELPGGYEGGRFGVFARGKASASFEYLYGMKGEEEIDFSQSNYFDYVKGGFVSDQLDARWIYQTAYRWVTSGGRRYKKRVINNQLFMTDFGPYAHEIRDYDVTFNDDEPAIASYPFISNESQVLVVDYVHNVLGAKMRLVNKSRHDAVINGEDTYTFGTENSINQRFMIYGTTLNINDERSVSIANRSAIDASGVEELTIDADWIQSEESAKKLGSHIVEAMSNSVSTYQLDIYGNPAVRVGQVVEIYNPQQGVGGLGSLNRFFVHGVSQSNSGTPTTTLSVREVIGANGLRNIKLRDVLAANNNAMNMNPEIDRFIRSGGAYLPLGYDIRPGVNARYTTSLNGNGNGIYMSGTGSTPYNTAVLLNPYPDNTGRFNYPYGDHFLFAINVTAITDCAVGIAVEGWPTTGGMTKVVTSKTATLAKGQSQDIILKGRFLTDSNIPEMELSIRALNSADTAQGAPTNESFVVNSVFFRSSQSQDGIYPLHGGERFKSF